MRRQRAQSGKARLQCAVHSCPPRPPSDNNHGLFLALSAVIQLPSGQQNSHAKAGLHPPSMKVCRCKHTCNLVLPLWPQAPVGRRADNKLALSLRSHPTSAVHIPKDR